MEIRKLQKVGGSVALLIPAKYAHRYKYAPGIPVLILPDEKGRLIIERVTPKTHPTLFGK